MEWSAKVEGIASPPVWVAWIEILFYCWPDPVTMSPPVWVAWIEIKEYIQEDCEINGRHPYGWRGLKYQQHKKT